MYKIDFKNSFIDFDKYIQIDELKNMLNKLKDESKLELLINYKEPFYYNFFNKKIPEIFLRDVTSKSLHTVPINDENPRSLLELIIKRVIVPTISNYLNNSIFINEFYKNYAKVYYEKMGKTINNYTVKSLSLDSTIIPFETAFYKFSNTRTIENVIDDLVMDILCKFKRTTITIKPLLSSNKSETVTLTVFDMLFRPHFSLDKINSKNKNCTFNFIEKREVYTVFEDFHYKEIIHDLNNYKMVECSKNYSYLCYNYTNYDEIIYSIIKRVTRYIFIHQFKQAFGYFLYSKKDKNPVINSIITDTDFYYTKNISTLKQNIKYFRNCLIDCKRSFENHCVDADLFRNIFNDIYNYWCKMNKSDKCFDEVNENMPKLISKINANEIDKDFVSILIKVISGIEQNDTSSLYNEYAYSFGYRWKKLIENNEFLNPEDYVASIRGF